MKSFLDEAKIYAENARTWDLLLNNCFGDTVNNCTAEIRLGLEDAFLAGAEFVINQLNTDLNNPALVETYLLGMQQGKEMAEKI
jgi:hypothetical protein